MKVLPVSAAYSLSYCNDMSISVIVGTKLRSGNPFLWDLVEAPFHAYHGSLQMGSILAWLLSGCIDIAGDPGQKKRLTLTDSPSRAAFVATFHRQEPMQGSPPSSIFSLSRIRHRPKVRCDGGNSGCHWQANGANNQLHQTESSTLSYATMSVKVPHLRARRSEGRTRAPRGGHAVVPFLQHTRSLVDRSISRGTGFV